MKTLLLRIVLLFFWLPVAGQVNDDADTPIKVSFGKNLTEYRLAYMPPKGFKEVYKQETALVGKLRLSSSKHQLESFSDSLVSYDTIKYNYKIRKYLF